MEENNRKDEKNIFNSIGSNEEITEPHVKQIISAFDGKVFSREDIDKFKQLETTFREISKLADGENILKNLTSEIREMIISGAQYHESDGTVSVGPVAVFALETSQKVYKENILANTTPTQDRVEKNKTVENEVIARYDEIVAKNNGSYLMTKEETEKFTNDFGNWLEVLGITDKETIQSTKDYMEKITERAGTIDEKGNVVDKEAAEAAEAAKELQEDPTKEHLIKFANAMLAVIEKDKNALKIRLEQIRADRAKAISEGYTAEGSVTDLEETGKATLDLKKQSDLYQKVIELAERGELDAAIKMLGAKKQELQAFVTIEDEMKVMEQDGDTKSDEYKRLKEEKDEFIRAQEIRRFEEKIQNLKKSLEAPDCTDYQRKKIYDEIYINQSKQIKQFRKMSGTAKEFLMKDFRTKPQQNLNRVGMIGRDENGQILRSAGAFNFATQLNNMYISTKGNISIIERQLGLPGKKIHILNNRSTTQYAMEAVREKYEEKLFKMFTLVKSTKDENERANVFNEASKIKSLYFKELQELNITTEEALETVHQFASLGQVLDPMEYQKYMWKSAVDNLRKHSKPQERIENIEEILKRCEENQDIFEIIKDEILKDPNKKAAYSGIISSLELLTGLSNENREKIVNAKSKEETLEIIASFCDSKCENKAEYSPEMKKQIKEIMESLYDQKGKDGIVTLFESIMGGRIAYKNMFRELSKEDLKTKYYDSLTEDQHVVMNATQADEEIEPGKWPEFLVNEETKMYLDMMFSMRRQLFTENDIAKRLVQIDPGAARDAYALYELGINKKALERTDLSENDKEEIKQRNKEIIEMMYAQYNAKMIKLAVELDLRIKNEDDPEKKEELIEQSRKNAVLLGKASRHRHVFDIEQAVFEMPDESIVDKSYRERHTKRKEVPISSSAKKTREEDGTDVKYVNMLREEKILDSTFADIVRSGLMNVETIDTSAIKENKEEHDSSTVVGVENIKKKTATVMYTQVRDNTAEVSDVARETRSQKGDIEIEDTGDSSTTVPKNSDDIEK